MASLLLQEQSRKMSDKGQREQLLNFLSGQLASDFSIPLPVLTIISWHITGAIISYKGNVCHLGNFAKKIHVILIKEVKIERGVGNFIFWLSNLFLLGPYFNSSIYSRTALLFQLFVAVVTRKICTEKKDPCQPYGSLSFLPLISIDPCLLQF